MGIIAEKRLTDLRLASRRFVTSTGEEDIKTVVSAAENVAGIHVLYAGIVVGKGGGYAALFFDGEIFAQTHHSGQSIIIRDVVFPAGVELTMHSRSGSGGAVNAYLSLLSAEI